MKINIWILLAFVTLSFPSIASVSLSTYRVEFSPQERIQQVYIFNRTEQSETYRLSVVDYEMTTKGELIYSKDIIKNSATKLLRVSPRQVTIPAGGNQIVKILARRPVDSMFSEYRSHLKLTQVPKSSVDQDIEQLLADNPKAVSVGLSVATEITIPVFIKMSESDHKLTIVDYSISDDESQNLNLTLQHIGSQTLYFDIDIYAVGSDKPIVSSRGQAIYYPLEKRHVALDLSTWDAQAPLSVVIRKHIKGLDSSGELLASINVDEVL